ncbi:MAG: hypothetical protein OQL09_08875 [Gammaproteobacteria bacterium]|nr:hypothetical protein [Gammaproteobacteria bacterium]
MSNNSIITFPINSWNHLYSLKAAIEHKQQSKGKVLAIVGSIRNTPLTQRQDTPIFIELLNVHGSPNYQTNTSGEIILGTLHYQDQGLKTQLSIDDEVFEEFRKNLMEYGDIEGIHIVVSLELEGNPDIATRQTMNILDLKYAMKGDA